MALRTFMLFCSHCCCLFPELFSSCKIETQYSLNANFSLPPSTWQPPFYFLFLWIWLLSVPHWKDWCWSWNANTLATWCEELTHLKRTWCWERMKVRGEGDDRGWDGWMAPLTQWIWVWMNYRSWWWTGRPGVLQSMGSQRLGHDWATELSWSTSYKWNHSVLFYACDLLYHLA